MKTGKTVQSKKRCKLSRTTETLILKPLWIGQRKSNVVKFYASLPWKMPSQLRMNHIDWIVVIVPLLSFFPLFLPFYLEQCLKIYTLLPRFPIFVHQSLELQFPFQYASHFAFFVFFIQLGWTFWKLDRLVGTNFLLERAGTVLAYPYTRIFQSFEMFAGLIASSCTVLDDLLIEFLFSIRGFFVSNRNNYCEKDRMKLILRIKSQCASKPRQEIFQIDVPNFVK